MQPIPVKTYPLERTYDSAEAAIAGAKAHPLQSQVKLDAKQLEGTTLIGSYWTLRDFVLQFSNGQWLHVFIENKKVRWRLAKTPPPLDEKDIERIGAPPVILAWTKRGEEFPMDRSTLLAERQGAAFCNLWINECGFSVYTREHLILIFHVLCRTDTGEDILFVTEDN